MAKKVNDIFHLKLGLRVKLVVPTVSIVAMSLAISSIGNVFKMRDGITDVCKQQAISIARVASDSVNVDYLNTMTTGSEGSPVHTKIVEKLTEVSNLGNISEIYCISSSGGTYSYAFDLSGDNAIGTYLDDTKDSKDMINLAFDGYSVVTDKMYECDGKYIITAYYPLIDSTKNITSVMVVDMDVTSTKEFINKQMIRSLINIVVFASVSTLLICIMLYAIIKNIKRIGLKIEEIAGEDGDLTQQLDVKAQDEIGLVSNSLNTLLRKLNDMMCNVNQIVVDVKESSSHMQSDCITTHERITMTSASSEEISATMEVVLDTVRNIDMTFASASEIAERIADIASKKSVDIEELSNGAQAIYEDSIQSKSEAMSRTEVIFENVLAKIKDSKSVTEIEALTSTVLDIASQTKLLSLNASIEAARVGEAGRGFAVVAMEMGKLAEQSANAVSEIQRISKTVVGAVEALTKETETLITFSKDVAENGYSNLMYLAEDYKSTVMDISSHFKTFASSSNELHEKMLHVKDDIEASVTAIDECNVAIFDVNVAIEDIMNASSSVQQLCDVNVKGVDMLSSYLDTFTFYENS